MCFSTTRGIFHGFRFREFCADKTRFLKPQLICMSTVTSQPDTHGIKKVQNQQKRQVLLLKRTNSFTLLHRSRCSPQSRWLSVCEDPQSSVSWLFPKVLFSSTEHHLWDDHEPDDWESSQTCNQQGYLPASTRFIEAASYSRSSRDNISYQPVTGRLCLVGFVRNVDRFRTEQAYLLIVRLNGMLKASVSVKENRMSAVPLYALGVN